MCAIQNRFIKFLHLPSTITSKLSAMKQHRFLFWIFLLASAAVNAQNNVGLYADCNYRGKKYFLAPGNYRLYQMQMDNDQLSALQIPNGMRVTLYEHDNFEGKSVTYTSNIACLGEDWNDQASSLVVERVNSRPDYNQNEYVTFFNDCYSRGFSQSLRPGTYSGNQLGNLYKNISSFTITGNLRVRAYSTSDNASGYSTYFENSESCLGNNMNDKIRSLVIEYKQGTSYPNYPPGGGSAYGGVTVYTDCNYRGSSMQLRTGYYEGSDLGLMRYNISSLEVPSHLRVKVFVNNEYLSGTSYYISENSSCLSSTLNNRIGSLIIEERSGTNNPQYPGNNNNTGGERVILYEDDNYRGLSSSVLPGTYPTMAAAGFSDNSLSSLYLPPGYRVVLYEFENFKGKTYTITATKSGFSISGWNDRTSSIAVYRN